MLERRAECSPVSHPGDHTRPLRNVQLMCKPPGAENEKAPGSSATRGFDGGDDGNRTHDPLLAKQTVAIW